MRSKFPDEQSYTVPQKSCSAGFLHLTPLTPPGFDPGFAVGFDPTFDPSFVTEPQTRFFKIFTYFYLQFNPPVSHGWSAASHGWSGASLESKIKTPNLHPIGSPYPLSKLRTRTCNISFFGGGKLNTCCFFPPTGAYRRILQRFSTSTEV